MRVSKTGYDEDARASDPTVADSWARSFLT